MAPELMRTVVHTNRESLGGPARGAHGAAAAGGGQRRDGRRAPHGRRRGGITAARGAPDGAGHVRHAGGRLAWSVHRRGPGRKEKHGDE